MSEIQYKEAFGYEAFGSHGSFGVKILLSADCDLSHEERSTVMRCANEIEEAVMRERIRRDPKAQESARRERDELVGLFDAPVFVEAIPNGYCSRWCCAHLPWFVVTTVKGRVTVGWRKRVIEISWEPSVGPQAVKLFPAEDATKSDRMIHAWGIDKAREYIRLLLGARPEGGPQATHRHQEDSLV